MTARLRIERLRLRVPADMAGRPELLAARVAEHLGQQAGDLGPATLDRVKIRVPAGEARPGPDALAGRIAAGVTRTLRGRGGA
ncbi:hypothetical protein [Roseospira navarrensis]|uniref:Uncharacterized protein n=1 Tax=Roseospira navarrensis TaxID=140058 RepID=A0A7X1ZHM3_9PROT|nr:hypothetical protein [Roseospira navarrensis]MQX37652.1 hypothetical protein [Roseospira navarrensis]